MPQRVQWHCLKMRLLKGDLHLVRYVSRSESRMRTGVSTGVSSSSLTQRALARFTCRIALKKMIFIIVFLDIADFT